MSDQRYKFNIHPEKKSVLLVELSKSVLGGSEAMDFTSQLDEYKEKGIELIVVNMANVEIINSSGLGMLVASMSNFRKQNIKLVLAAVPEKVSNLLEMTHLDRVFEIYESIDSAVV